MCQPKVPYSGLILLPPHRNAVRYWLKSATLGATAILWPLSTWSTYQQDQVHILFPQRRETTNNICRINRVLPY